MLEIRVVREKYNNLWLLLFFYLLLNVAFAAVIRNEYAFVKSNLSYSFSYTKAILAFLCVALHVSILTLLPSSGFYYSILSLLLVFFVFPSAVIFTYVRDIDYRIFMSHNLLFFAVWLVGRIKIKIKFHRINIQQSKKILLLVVLFGMIPFLLLYLPYINLKNLLLVDIYETRALMDAQVNNIYTDYSYSWFNKFIIPCLLVFGIYYRDKPSVWIASLALLFLYLCGAHKTVFVGLILTFLLYKFEFYAKIRYILIAMIATGLCALFVSLIFDTDYIMTMTLRRAFLLPALMDVLYFDMFDNNHLLWSETFDGLFRHYPYNTEHAYVIGEKYLNDPAWGANNGIVSDGFMNAGMAGVILNIFIIGLFFSILNQLGISHHFFGLFFLFVFLIVSSSLSTVMLTHGGIVLILLAFFIMKNSSIEMRDKG